MAGVERREDAGLPDYARYAERRDHHEPREHDRTEHLADGVRAAALRDEQDHQDGDGDGQHERLEAWGHDGEAFHGAQHRDGRRDHAVAYQQGRSEEPEQHEHAPCSDRASSQRRDERRQDEDPALPVAVRSHGDDGVLHGDDEEERPEDEREHSEHGFGLDRQAMRLGERFPHGVQGAGADVAEDHAERDQGERQGSPGCGGRGPLKARRHRAAHTPSPGRGPRVTQVTDG